MSNVEVYLGWDVGGTKSAAVVATARGEVLARDEYPSRAEQGSEGMIAEFISRATPLLERHPGVRAVGVSIGGPMNGRTGLVIAPVHLPGWNNVPLPQILQERLGLRAYVEHDAAACLLAEWLWGGARGCTHAVYLTCGTGLGAGILIDGRVLRGPDGQSPEAGHIRMAPDGPEMFQRKGSAETFGSGTGVGKLAAWMFPERFGSPVDPRLLIELARGADADAKSVLAESAEKTGRFCAILSDIFAPQVILLGSLGRYFGDEWLAGVERAFREEALEYNARHTRIMAAQLGARLQDLSAIAPCVAARPTQESRGL